MRDNNHNRRINLRVSDRNLFDDMQIHAHSKGMTLPLWARTVLQSEMVRSETEAIFARQSLLSVLTIQKLVEREHPSVEIEKAKRKAREYIQRIQNDSQ